MAVGVFSQAFLWRIISLLVRIVLHTNPVQYLMVAKITETVHQLQNQIQLTISGVIMEQ